MQSQRFSINPEQQQLILNIVIHALVGLGLTLISEVFLKINYGIYAPFITTILSVLSLSGKIYLSGPSADQIKIQQLMQQVQTLQTPVQTDVTSELQAKM